MDIVKILAICLITAVLAVVIKQYKPEYAVITVLAGSVIILIYILGFIYSPIEYLKTELEKCGVNAEYYKTAVKALGIAYVTGFIADSCRDCGQTSMATKAELAGKCAIFLLCIPLISSVLQTALGFIV